MLYVVITDQKYPYIVPLTDRVYVKVFSKEKSRLLPSPFLANMAVPISVALAVVPHSCATTFNGTVCGWPSGSTVSKIA